MKLTNGTMTAANLTLDQITIGKNVRPENEFGDMFALQRSIADGGLHQPLIVYKETVKAGQAAVHRLLCGNRRIKAIADLKRQDLPQFEIQFNTGIPCVVYSGITSDEADEIRADDADSKHAVTSTYALQLSANIHFTNNLSERQTMIRVMGLLKEPPAVKSAKLVLVRIDRDKAVAAEAWDTVKVLDEKIIDELFICHRGTIQRLKNVWRCPPIVLACYHRAATGQNPEGFEKAVLPVLKTTDPVVLWKAHEADSKILDEEERPKYTKLCVGPAFKAAFDKIIERNKDKAEQTASAEPRPKMMSAKDLNAELTEGKWNSHFGRQMTSRHADSKKAIPELPSLDFDCYMGEVVKAGNPELWADVVKEAKAILQARSEAEDVTNGREEATETEVAETKE